LLVIVTPVLDCLFGWVAQQGPKLLCFSCAAHSKLSPLCEQPRQEAQRSCAFGKSGLPRRDWRLFKRPLISALASSVHCMDAWLLRVQTACSRKDRRDTEALDPSVNAAEDNLPSMNGPCRVLQQFLKSAAQTQSPQPRSPPTCSHLEISLQGTFMSLVVWH
jgi:hypothetical protein